MNLMDVFFVSLGVGFFLVLIVVVDRVFPRTKP